MIKKEYLHPRVTWLKGLRGDFWNCLYCRVGGECDQEMSKSKGEEEISTHQSILVLLQTHPRLLLLDDGQLVLFVCLELDFTKAMSFFLALGGE